MALGGGRGMASSEILLSLWIHCSEENAWVYGRKKELLLLLSHFSRLSCC